MAKYPCPVCGDQSAYLFWYGDPPDRCPYDVQEGDPQIETVTDCQHQLNKAWQAAEFRRLVPDAFDNAGAILPDQLPRVLAAFNAAHPDKPLVLG